MLYCTILCPLRSGVLNLSGIGRQEGLNACSKLQNEETCKNHPYLHASMWMAPLPHEDSHIVKGKSGAPLGGCHHDVNSHAGARGLPTMPIFGAWAQVPVPMHM
jgi:hypothetical protein